MRGQFQSDKLRRETGSRNLKVQCINQKGEEMNVSRQSQALLPPGCGVYSLLGGALPPSATEVKAFLIFLAVISSVTFPFTAALNLLVVMAVKTKSRMRAIKPNILLACLATTDLTVGVIVQPMFIALMITIVQGNITTRSCSLQNITKFVTSVLCESSLIHLGLISGERYLAMKHPYAYNNGLVTEARLLTSSVLAWFFSLILHIPLIIDRDVFLIMTNIFIGLSFAIIVFCQISVYREVRRHEKQISTQQVTEEARQKFLKDKRAFKLTAIVVSVLFICYIPTCVFRVVLTNFRSNMFVQTAYACFYLVTYMEILNSFLNPIIYSVRMRQIRVAFIEITCRVANIARAEEIEMRMFGSHNPVGQTRRGGERAQQNAEQENTNNTTDEMLRQHEIHFAQQSDSTSPPQ